MSRFLLAGVASLIALPAFAGDYGCGSGACYRQTYVPPAYETITEKVMVRAPRTYAVTTPPQYETVQETVQVAPGGRRWVVSRDAYGQVVGCWVSTPPRYATVNRTVMVRAAETVPYAVPAVYGYRSQTVQTSPGYRSWVPTGSGYGGGYRSAGYGYGGGYRQAGYGYGAGGLVGGAVDAGVGIAGAGLAAGGAAVGLAAAPFGY